MFNISTAFGIAFIMCVFFVFVLFFVVVLVLVLFFKEPVLIKSVLEHRLFEHPVYLVFQQSFLSIV
jgi:hypothetical protein